MKIKRGKGPTKYGPGIDIKLSGNDLAKAIDLWLHSQECHINGPRTIFVAGELARDVRARVYVDPSEPIVYRGKVIKGDDL